MANRIVPLLIFVAVCAAAATFAYFDSFAYLTDGRRGWPLAGFWPALLVALLLSAPILAIGVVVWPTRTMIVLCSLHAAVFASFLAVTTVTFRPEHSPIGDSLAPVLLLILWQILVVELVMIFIALPRSLDIAAYETFRSVFAGFTIPVLVGWLVGVLAWSETLPSRVVTGAETVAASRPYCVEVDGMPAKSRRSLVAWRLLADNGGNNFHALMVIGSVTERSYANWSYRLGRFVPISDDARANIQLDRAVKCQPSEHFLLKL
jgi:hypothetical protein